MSDEMISLFENGLFGNIVEIEESLWVIVIDEIDEAKLDEIKSAIDVVEKFKSESIIGFPLRILFLFCYLSKMLKKNLKNSDDNYTKAVINNFFFGKTKFIERKFLIPLNRENKKHYMLNQMIEKKVQIVFPDVQMNIIEKIFQSPPEKFVKEEELLYKCQIQLEKLVFFCLDNERLPKFIKTRKFC